MRVLVVDDDPASRHVLAAHLSGLAECTLCGSGTEALAAVAQAIVEGAPFDVVFLDIIMPHMDGHETLAQIRETEETACLPPQSRARAVMVTSMDDETNTLNALFDGQVAAYLIKPASRSELLNKLALLGLL
ncbi:response regulator [Desulfovibrio aerotolerans]|uniref:Response regulator n=1 Tax=Solidesulfovibrio aerotolerans TaxID=295255 RepID=A0A7C9NKG1_9BACT|nr:response regulator [Solidesulfovibrio aerotolerans]MYL84016.1 response regulator [Solidesulfovibrio aerotolerans]